jgi:hypothetical protein
VEAYDGEPRRLNEGIMHFLLPFVVVVAAVPSDENYYC